jgi:hypothetical protein
MTVKVVPSKFAVGDVFQADASLYILATRKGEDEPSYFVAQFKTVADYTAAWRDPSCQRLTDFNTSKKYVVESVPRNGSVEARELAQDGSYDSRGRKIELGSGLAVNIIGKMKRVFTP